MLAAIVSLALGSKILLPDLTGKDVQVFPTRAAKGVVAFFVLAGCPNANSYVPEMNRIAKKYGPKGWNFYLVFADQSPNLNDLKSNVKQFGYAFPVLHGQGELLTLSKVTVSPEVAVISSSSKLLYHGRIDDRFYALGKQRLSPTVHDLRSALEAIDAGRPVQHPETLAVGCFLPKS